MPATRMRRAGAGGSARRRQRLDLVGREEEPVAGLAALAEVAPRVVVDHDGELDVAVEVLVDALDQRGAAGQREVHDVAAGARAQSHAAAAPQLDAVDEHGVGRRALELLPVAAVALMAPHRRDLARQAPLRRSSSSSVSASVRSRISRARGSESRISAFSSSVRLRMLSVSSWSISPPSNRSPGLSGAIRGWSSRMIGEDSSVPRSPGAPTSTGHVPSLRQAPAASRSASGGSVSETKRPPARAQHGVGRAERPPEHRLARAAGPRRRVGDPTVRRSNPRPARPPPRPIPSGPPSARDPAGAGHRVAQDLVLAPARRRTARPAAQRGERQRAGGDLALDRLLPRQVALPVDRQLVHVREPVRRRALHPALDDVQEAHAHVDRRARSPPASSRHCVRIVHGSSSRPRLWASG